MQRISARTSKRAMVLLRVRNRLEYLGDGFDKVASSRFLAYYRQYASVALHIQRIWRGFRARQSVRDLRAERCMQVFAANKLQSQVRVLLFRKKVHSICLNSAQTRAQQLQHKRLCQSAVKIQHQAKAYMFRRSVQIASTWLAQKRRRQTQLQTRRDNVCRIEAQALVFLFRKNIDARCRLRCARLAQDATRTTEKDLQIRQCAIRKIEAQVQVCLTRRSVNKAVRMLLMKKCAVRRIERQVKAFLIRRMVHLQNCSLEKQHQHLHAMVSKIQAQVRAFLFRRSLFEASSLRVQEIARKQQTEQAQRRAATLMQMQSKALDERRQRARMKVQERAAKQIQAQVRAVSFRRTVERACQTRQASQCEQFLKSQQAAKQIQMQMRAVLFRRSVVRACRSRKELRFEQVAESQMEAFLRRAVITQQCQRNVAAGAIQQHWRAVAARREETVKRMQGAAKHIQTTWRKVLFRRAEMNTCDVRQKVVLNQAARRIQTAWQKATHQKSKEVKIKNVQHSVKNRPSDTADGTLTPSSGGTGISRSSSPDSSESERHQGVGVTLNFPPGAFYEEGALPPALTLSRLRKEAEQALAQGRITMERNTLLRGQGSKVHYATSLPTSLELTRWLCCHYSLKPTSLRLNVMRAGDTLRFHRDPRYDGSDFTAVCCLCDDEACVPLEFIPSENRPSDDAVEIGRFQIPCVNGSVYGFDERINACGRYLHGIDIPVQAGERWCILVGGLQVSADEMEYNMATWLTRSALHQVEVAKSYPTGPSSVRAAVKT